MMDLKGKRRRLKITPSLHGEREPLCFEHTIDYLQKVVYECAQAKYGAELNDEVKDCLEYELAVIRKHDYAGLFLWLCEVVAEARSMGVYVGPARGAAPASLILYLLGVTSIDPIAHGLLVERFVNGYSVAPLYIQLAVAPDGCPDFIDWCQKHLGVSVDTETSLYTINESSSVQVALLALSSLSRLRVAESQWGINMEAIPLDDPKVFELLSSGDTDGVYMCESQTVRGWLVDLQPSRFSDLVALLALNRPDIKDHIPQFIDRKHGREPIVNQLEVMDELLQETYGMIVYQEQLMRLGQRVAGFTRDDSDLLRRVLCKAYLESEIQQRFVTGAIQHGYPTEVIEELWSKLFREGRYAYSKSHAVSQALIAYQTAYLKLKFSTEVSNLDS